MVRRENEDAPEARLLQPVSEVATVPRLGRDVSVPIELVALMRVSGLEDRAHRLHVFLSVDSAGADGFRRRITLYGILRASAV
jgi:hypothetical protein